MGFDSRTDYKAFCISPCKLITYEGFFYVKMQARGKTGGKKSPVLFVFG